MLFKLLDDHIDLRHIERIISFMEMRRLSQLVLTVAGKQLSWYASDAQPGQIEALAIAHATLQAVVGHLPPAEPQLTTNPHIFNGQAIDLNTVARLTGVRREDRRYPGRHGAHITNGPITGTQFELLVDTTAGDHAMRRYFQATQPINVADMETAHTQLLTAWAAILPLYQDTPQDAA